MTETNWISEERERAKGRNAEIPERARMIVTSPTLSAHMRAVAEAATPGPWGQGMAGKVPLPEVDNRFRFGMVVLDDAGTDDCDGGLSTAEHIATFDPSTVLALLDALAGLAAVEALLVTLDADLKAAEPRHFSIDLMRGRVKQLLAQCQVGA